MIKEFLTICTLPINMALDVVVIPLTAGERSLTAESIESLNNK